MKWGGFWLGAGMAMLLGVGGPARGQEGTAEAVVGIRGQMTFHAPDCTVMKRQPARLRVKLASADAAVAAGYRACSICQSAEGESPPEAAASSEGVSFLRDVAPILVGNCVGCHNPKDKARRANFDLSNFAALLAGGDSGPGIVPGKPAQSLLLQRVKGEATPKMPPGQRNLSDEAIGRIEAWILRGAKLDAGVAAAAELDKVAPTPEQLRQAALAKLSPEELDKKLEEAGRERWRKASAEEPEVRSSRRFLLLSQLPDERAEALMKELEIGLTAAQTVVGPESAKLIPAAGKLSVYVFNDRNQYVEFVRAVEGREPEEGQQAHARVEVEAPYAAGVDPLAGGPEPAPADTGKASRKRSPMDELAIGPERTVGGLVLEAIGTELISRAGKAPGWLSLGFGAFLGASAEPRSSYYKELRRGVAGVYRQGWMTRVVELLGGQGDKQEVRGAGFSLLEWLYSTNRPAFTPFVREMVKDGSKLDEVLQKGFRVNREQFLNSWGAWVALKYGGGQ